MLPLIRKRNKIVFWGGEIGSRASWEVSARLHLLHPSSPALAASFPPTLVKGVYSAQIFKVGSWESSASGPAHKTKSGRAVGLSLPTFVSARTQASIRKRSRPQVESRRLRVLRPAGGAVGWRAVSAQGSGREARGRPAPPRPAPPPPPPPPHVPPLRPRWPLVPSACGWAPAMGAAAAGTRVFLEVRRRLQSALLVFGEPKEGGMSMDISITPCSLQVKTPEGCTELQLPAEVRLVPSSCGGLRYVPGDGLHLRLQVQAESNAKLVSMFNQSSQAQECCTFYCQSCGEVIIRDRELIRVLPLPSENWGALVEEWCCHPDPFANKPLHPQENDCFIGDSFFLVNLRSDLWQPRPELAPVETCCPSSENHFKLKPKANTKVICKRCKVMLGETMSSETTKFYMTEIIIQPSERNFPIIPRSQFVQSIIAQCLVELSTARSTFRFTVQGHDGKVYILLWILNSDSLVIESLRSSKSIKKFSLLEDILKADSGSAWNAVKVLYQPCIKSRNEKLSSAWESDISIHSLTLPSATCLELLLILSRNNATLPPSLRYMNSFQVAFLKM